MKTAFAAALLSLCLSAQAFYVLIDAGPAAWLDGHKVEQVSVELFNGDPAIPGELARSRQPFDAANLKAVNGQIVAMTEAEISARDAAEAQAAQEAAEQAAYEASLPVPMPTGVEVPWVVFLDATNRAKGIAMELTTNNVPIYYEFHASPVDWKKVDANRKAALSAAAAKEKDSADAIAYAKDKAAKDGVAKAEAVAATNGKEPSDKEKIALMWKHYLAVVGAEKK